MPVTEIGCMGVKPSLDVMNERTTEGQILSNLYNYVITAPGGPLRVFWGIKTEDPSYLWALFDWDSIEDHASFATKLGKEAVKDMPKILTHGLFTKHIRLTPSAPVALRSSVTEVILAYFPSAVLSTGKDAAIAQLKAFEEGELRGCSNMEALSYGWGVESDFPVRGGAGDQRASILTSFIGFDSIEAKTKFKQSSTFERLLSLIRDMEGIIKLEAFPVEFRSVSRKSEEEDV